MIAQRATPNGRRRRTTLADVAKAAGVSTSTASRALRDHPRVSAATRQRVVAIADQLGFARNDLARSLRLQASMLVGVVVPDVAIPFYASVLKGAQSRLEGAGYEVLVMNTEREPAREQRALRTLQSRQVDAVLVATSGGFAPLDVPVVFFDHVLTGAGAGAVAPDNEAGMSLLVEHLADIHGHRRIAFLGAPVTSAPGAAVLEGGPAYERREAFRAAMGRRGLPVAPEYLACADHGWSQAAAERAVAGLLGLSDPPTAIVAAGDTLALGALRALRRHGRAVPADVALVSFDDPEDADLLSSPLTALGRHDRELGDLAAELLLRALAGEPAEPEPVRLTLQLVVRRSCGCGAQAAS
ncbi:LacI family transcriptional regulator [Baekduia soli]|uniref:LacI family transcriptional regulator n=1 Tax=Baekduia soli TaxID=496014 RepID=A0A5B8UBT3_9ACTN|nr:LacI family DNA-binding transcriptional regulator [Baekduia soli]QEC50444.1 LacI family transcriptional regulator [Baekduia soli]